MKVIKTSAPGKMYLFGEHASVYGFPSIPLAIDQRIFCTLKERDDKKIVFNFPDLKILNYEYDGSLTTKSTAFISAVVNRVLKKVGDRKGFEVETKSEMQLGFGTSAASIVAVTGALNEFFSLNMNKEQIFRLGHQAVLDVQGVGSGFDVAVSTYGGIIRYVKGKVPTPLQYPKDLPLVIGYTGVKADTPSLVKMVARKKEKHPDFINKIFEIIGLGVKKAEKALAGNDLETIADVMNFNHSLLDALGVSSYELEKLILAARRAGAIGAKLSGAGGGDCMLALAPGNVKKVMEAIKKSGGVPIEVKIGEGLRIEEVFD